MIACPVCLSLPLFMEDYTNDTFCLCGRFTVVDPDGGREFSFRSSYRPDVELALLQGRLFLRDRSLGWGHEEEVPEAERERTVERLIRIAVAEDVMAG